MVASYEPNEVNFFVELPPLNASEAASADVMTLEAIVKNILEPSFEPTSEIRQALLSR